MRSMTGFGRGAVTDGDFNVSFELKTVNNRFLDVALRLPSEMAQLETTIKRTVGARLSRGRVEVGMQYDRTAETVYEINRPLIAGFISAMKDIQKEFSLPGEPDLNVIARLPNVLQPRRTEPDAAFAGAADTALNLALDDLEKMRESEGEMLRTELESRLSEIARRLPVIAAEAENVGEEYRLRLTKRIEEILSKTGSQIEIDQSRLAQEIAYLADRADISEELARLTTHIDHFRAIMSEDREVGKRLDFLTQELNREANTIASKTNNMVVKENALQIKSEIEKIREQIQNVE